MSHNFLSSILQLTWFSGRRRYTFHMLHAFFISRYSFHGFAGATCLRKSTESKSEEDTAAFSKGCKGSRCSGSCLQGGFDFYPTCFRFSRRRRQGLGHSTWICDPCFSWPWRRCKRIGFPAGSRPDHLCYCRAYITTYHSVRGHSITSLRFIR